MTPELGVRIKALRQKKGWTLEKLAQLADTSKSSIWELENKNPPHPSVNKIKRIAKQLGVTTAYLLGESDGEDNVEDAYFYRKYQQMPAEAKEKIRTIIDLWDDDSDETRPADIPSPMKWAFDLTRLWKAYSPENRFPVDVKFLAKQYSKQSFPDDPITLVKGGEITGFEGALVRAPERKKGWGIIYNSAMQSQGRINFTLAHEFGHYLIHRNQFPEGIQCKDEDFRKWDSEYNIIEQEANDFAANLIMPLDDFREQISPTSQASMDNLLYCGKRYNTSFTASILRWLQYTEKRSMLVVSRDGYILWARSSAPALKNGIFLKTAGLEPVSVPETSLASQPKQFNSNSVVAEYDAGVWLKDLDIPCSEETYLAKNYDLTFSLLHFDDSDSGFINYNMQK